MEQQKIYRYATKRKMTLEQIAALFPPEREKWEPAVEEVRDILNIKAEGLPLQEVDVSEGVYVKALSFPSRKEVEMRFNNGNIKKVSQQNGFYKVGEHVYSFSDSVIGKHSLKHSTVQDVVHYLNDLETFLPVTNTQWMSMLYDLFPKVRKPCQDALYNQYDTNQVLKRVEAFQAYVTYGVDQVLKSLRKYTKVTLGLIDFTRKSSALLEDMLASENSLRLEHGRDRIKTVHVSDGSVLDTDQFVCYIMDLWVYPSKLDHRICSTTLKQQDIDERIGNALCDRARKSSRKIYISPSSVLVIGSYKPILDVYRHGDLIHRDVPYEYEYAQWQYVPHKPWTIIMLANAGFEIPNVYDSTKRETSKLYLHRMTQWMRMLFVNIARNILLSNVERRKECIAQKELQKSIVRTLKSKPDSWWNYQIMKNFVHLRSSTMTVKTATPEDAIRLTICVSKLLPDERYSQTDLRLAGWKDQDIVRGLNMSLIYEVRSNTTATYMVRKSVLGPRKRSRFRESSKVGEAQISFIDMEGTVHAIDHQKDDVQIQIQAQVPSLLSKSRDFSQPAPYTTEDILSSKRTHLNSKVERYKYRSSYNEIYDHLDDETGGFIIIQKNGRNGRKGKKKKSNKEFKEKTKDGGEQIDEVRNNSEEEQRNKEYKFKKKYKKKENLNSFQSAIQLVATQEKVDRDMEIQSAPTLPQWLPTKKKKKRSTGLDPPPASSLQHEESPCNQIFDIADFIGFDSSWGPERLAKEIDCWTDLGRMDVVEFLNRNLNM